VSTLGKMIQLHQFYFNHILTFFKSLLLSVHNDSVAYVHLCSQYQKYHTHNSAAGQALTTSIKKSYFCDEIILKCC